MDRREDFSIQHLASMSAFFNGVLIPGRSIERTVASFVFNVFTSNDNVDWPVSLRGTGTAVRFDNQELFVCTQHQLHGVDRQTVGMMADGGGLLVTSGGERHYPLNAESDAYDLVAFNFSEPVAVHPQFRSRFFNFRRPDRTAGGEVVAYLLAGFPYEDQIYDAVNMCIARRLVVCSPNVEQSADPALLLVHPLEPLRFNPDGMSGGTAFAVRLHNDGFWIDFAGIVVRGGPEGFYFIKAGVVFDFLNNCAWKKAV